MDVTLLTTLLSIFMIGGTVFAGVYYLSTVVKNPALGALLGAAPLSILCIYVLTTKNVARCYVQNIIIVMILTVLSLLVLYYLLHYYSPVIAVTIALLLWTILQKIKYDYLDRHHPEFQKIK